MSKFSSADQAAFLYATQNGMGDTLFGMLDVYDRFTFRDHPDEVLRKVSRNQYTNGSKTFTTSKRTAVFTKR